MNAFEGASLDPIFKSEITPHTYHADQHQADDEPEALGMTDERHINSIHAENSGH